MSDNTDLESKILTVAFERKGESIALIGRVSSDRLKLFLDCKLIDSKAPVPDQNRAFSELRSLLKDIPEKFLSLDTLRDIASLIAAGKPVENRRIAKGQAAETGTDGRLLFLVRKYAGNKNGMKFENIDPTFLNAFDNLEIGCVVARLFNPTPGIPGIDVFGDVIPPKAGQRAKVLLDRTLRLDPCEEGQLSQNIVALAEGFLAEEEQKLSIKTVLSLNCDVGPRTGNIEFIGGVAVNGSLMNSARISARGHVKIVRDVLNGTVFSSAGGISILGSATGDLMETIDEATSKAKLASGSSGKVSSLKGGIDFRCAGDLVAQTAQGISADVGGNITITKEASHCWLSCRGALKMETGHLYNAEVFVAQGVFAKKIGSRSGSSTVIHLADGIHGTAEYRDLKENILKCTSARDVLMLHLGPYANDPLKLSSLQGQHKAKICELLKKLNIVQQTLTELILKREQLEASISLDGLYYVTVSDAFYRGSEIVVNEKRFTTENDLYGANTIEFDAAAQEFRVHNGKKQK